MNGSGWTAYVSFADLLKYVVERGGWTEERIPMNAPFGAPSRVIDRLTGEARRGLSDLRTNPAAEKPRVLARSSRSF